MHEERDGHPDGEKQTAPGADVGTHTSGSYAHGGADWGSDRPAYK